MPSKGPRVDAGDRGNAVGAQEGCQLPRIVEDRGGGIGHHQPAQPRLHRLVVVDQSAVVADQRVGHDHDLARVRRVGADLLVAGLARVDHEVAARRDRRSECDAAEDRAVLERQQSRTQVTDPGIDDGGGPDMRRRDHQGVRAPGNWFEKMGRPSVWVARRHAPPMTRDTVDQPPSRPLGTGTPASQDRPQRNAVSVAREARSAILA